MNEKDLNNSAPFGILVVEDDPNVLAFYRRVLKSFPNVFYADSGTAALELIARAPAIDLALIDFLLPGAGGAEVVRALKGRFPDCEAVVITANDNVPGAVEALRAGASNYLIKPVGPSIILPLAKKCWERLRLKEENERLKSLIFGPDRRVMIAGKSKAMERVMELVEAVAGVDTAVLILGETGTGKDLLARVIHDKSARSAGPFVIADCAALSDPLIESDLFGHEKGAFTGAAVQRKGRFERAEGGTIFINEIGLCSFGAQGKLLRVIENGELERLGGTATLKVNVRVIAATNGNLPGDVNAGRFRKDLYYRINTVTLFLPPLRERLEDLSSLADYFLRVYAGKYGKEVRGFAAPALAALFRHSWPGNIRELEHVIERSVITAGESLITLEDLRALPEEETAPPSYFSAAPSPSAAFSSRAVSVCLAEKEKAAIREALRESGRNLSRAAAALGIARSTLYSKMAKHGLRS
jgi:two-component system response regulator HydG